MEHLDVDENDENDEAPTGRAGEWASAKRLLARPPAQPRVEEALLRAFERRHAPLPWYRRLAASWRTAGLGLAGAGCIAALAMAGFIRLPGLAPAPGGTFAVAALEEGFLPLVDARHMRMATHVQVLHAELPRHALESLGIPTDETMPDELVRADLVVTEQGEPIAIRLAIN